MTEGYSSSASFDGKLNAMAFGEIKTNLQGEKLWC
jgi:hypothetical protein